MKSSFDTYGRVTRVKTPQLTTAYAVPEGIHPRSKNMACITWLRDRHPETTTTREVAIELKISTRDAFDLLTKFSRRGLIVSTSPDIFSFGGSRWALAEKALEVETSFKTKFTVVEVLCCH